MVLNIHVNTFFHLFLVRFWRGDGGGGGGERERDIGSPGLYLLYGCLDCASYQANTIQIGQATWTAFTSKKEMQPEFIIINCKIGE